MKLENKKYWSELVQLLVNTQITPEGQTTDTCICYVQYIVKARSYNA